MRLERRYDDLSRPAREFTFVVDALEEGLRLDALLRAHYPWKSRTHYQRIVARGDVLLDGKPSKASSRVRRGTRIVVRLPADPLAPERETADDLVFLYEDEALAAIDKPSGMTVHPTGRIRHGTLINKLHARYRSESPDADVVPRLAHRLDQDTSGVVLIVKNRRVDALVTEQFTRREVEKTYLALVQGVPREAQGLVDVPLKRDPHGGTHLHMHVHPAGQVARSRWRVLQAFGRHALLALSPLTGRQHQLRVHMAHLGHPILCDHLYGDLRPLMRPAAPRVVLLDRLALHAHRLRLAHPLTGEALDFTSPLPPDLQRAVDALGAEGAA
jgi:23S rRNA pseudouridine1911/1915/1917 synthase